ncbi:hypothetical protein [Marinobacter fonticola]|uniref:hypothetical protein n=1 Tax=Marinobacter fonticola TaxID=2603215 RepID=UPI0011E72F70|nr:hypothetical protein [Marinobacter fonticola]
MTAFLTVCVIGLLAGSGLLLLRLRRQSASLNDALERLQKLGGDVSEPQSDPYMVLTIRVLDPMGVAKRESRSARIVADHLPNMVCRRVYQQVMREVGAELAERGVEAEMKVEYR